MSFFIRNKQFNGVKRAKYSSDKSKKRKLVTKTKKAPKNEEVTSSEEDDDVPEKVFDDDSSSEETAQDKKIRLAKMYLEEIEKEERTRLEHKEIDENVIAKRLKEDYLKETGKLRLNVADKYKEVDISNIKTLKCRQQRGSITCLCVSNDDKYIFVGSKDAVVVKYCLTDNIKVGIIPFVKQPDPNNILGHSKKILSIAISTNNKFLAVGDESQNIYIWNPMSLKFLKKLTGHRGAITGLCFKKDTNTLYSCSTDRTAKVWNLEEMTYVETLFGHQDSISSIDTLYKDRVATSGGRDLRIWKIIEETQLIFNGHSGNIDSVKMLNEENFVSAGDDGQICVWSMLRKKPICIINNSHGIDESNQQPYWISSIACLMNTDLIASGSKNDGIKLWKLDDNFRTANVLFNIPVDGFINSMSFTSNGCKLVAGISKEHRFGRWTTLRDVKNCVIIYPLKKVS